MSDNKDYTGAGNYRKLQLKRVTQLQMEHLQAAQNLENKILSQRVLIATTMASAFITHYGATVSVKELTEDAYAYADAIIKIGGEDENGSND